MDVKSKAYQELLKKLSLIHISISEKIRKFAGPARVFNSDEEAHRAVVTGEVKKGDVVVIRYEEMCIRDSRINIRRGRQSPKL